METVVGAGAGFLLAVLWFDLMHDVLVRAHPDGAPLPEPVLASIAGYYRRVVVDAHPMNKLVATAMAVTLGGIIAELVSSTDPMWAPWASLVLASGAIGLAGLRTVPAARRLGLREDDDVTQSRLARQCYADHVVCFVAMSAVLVAQLVVAVSS